MQYVYVTKREEDDENKTKYQRCCLLWCDAKGTREWGGARRGGLKRREK